MNQGNSRKEEMKESKRKKIDRHSQHLLDWKPAVCMILMFAYTAM